MALLQCKLHKDKDFSMSSQGWHNDCVRSCAPEDFRVVSKQRKINRLMKKTLIVAIATVITCALTSIGHAQQRGPGQPARTPTLSEEAKAALVYALAGDEGEYAARARYAAIIAKFGPLQPFVNILKAEEQHIAVLKQQCVKYGVAVPEDTKVVTVPDTLLEAAKAAAEYEVLNAAMYGELLPIVASYPSLVTTFTNLGTASEESHLAALESAIEVLENGGTLPTAAVQQSKAQKGFRKACTQ